MSTANIDSRSLIIPALSRAPSQAQSMPRPRAAAVSAPAVRGAEWVIAGFLIYATVTALCLPIAPALRSRVLVVNLALILGYSLVIYVDSGKRCSRSASRVTGCRSQ